MHITKNQIKLLRSLSQRKYREKEHLFIAEGSKCVRELASKFECLWVIIENGINFSIENITVLEATTTEIQQISTLKKPQGIIGIFKLPSPEALPSLNILERDIVLLLDDIQDPGNLGTIIRTADWFGVHHIVCSDKTADCFNPKVVQATMGSLARVQVSYTNLSSYLQDMREAYPACPIYGTLLNGNDIFKTPLEHNGIIIMGNEGNGISPAIQEYLTTPLTIPPFDTCSHPDSLNVAIATAIILATLRQY